ncbi:hypothetical protein [Chlamydia felis Fe/C-56]|uniref:Uncharacterized protein n=1 Tax=Chlamydia felis (strain Fe/C-56) TaxID=264202 RepID=Q253U8_CHLFF|nr:hypothetical protein [Chlamydia felis Fe/C-56]
MLKVFIYIPAHTHLDTNGTTSEQPKSTSLRVPQDVINPSTGTLYLMRILSSLPLIGLFMASYFLYQKHCVMKSQYAKLAYEPNSACSNTTCSRLAQSHLNSFILMSTLGGLGLLIPALAILFLVEQLLNCCCC